MPATREKMIHSVGSVCEFEWDISSESPYSGLLGPGTKTGFIRMGGAVDPSDGLTPGLGFKIPRSGVHDGDWVMLHSLAFGDSWNFFLKNMSNHIAPASGVTKILAKKFEEASQCPFHVGLSDLARYSQDGVESNPPNFPFKLFMIPNANLQTGRNGQNLDAVHAEIDALPIGTTLYTVYACSKAAGDELDPTIDLSRCGGAMLLGSIVTTKQCTTSWYGDTSFHIRHQRIEDDWLLRPDYMQMESYTATTACDKSSLYADAAPPICGTEGTMLGGDV